MQREEREPWTDFIDRIGLDWWLLLILNSPWTRMTTVAKRHAGGIRGNELGSSVRAWIMLAYFGKPHAVKPFRVGVQLGIHGDGMGGDAYGGVRRDGEAVAQLPVFRDNTFKGYCSRRSACRLRIQKWNGDVCLSCLIYEVEVEVRSTNVPKSSGFNLWLSFIMLSIFCILT